MNCVKKHPSALEQRRARCVEQFVANYDNAIRLHRGHVSPSKITRCLFGLCAVACRRPCEPDYIGPGSGDIFIRHARSTWQDAFSTSNLDKLRDLERGTEPRVRPCLAIDTWLGPSVNFRRTTGHAAETFLQVANQPLRTRSTARQASQGANGIFDVG